MKDAQRSMPSLYPFRFWGRAALLCALGCAVGVAVLRWVFWQDLGASYAEAFHTLRNLNRFLVPAMLLSLLLVLLVVSAALSVFAVVTSHRIAGPLFRLQRVGDHLSRMTLVGAIHLREKDWVKPTSAAINAWVAGHKKYYRDGVAWAEEADLALLQAKHAISAGDSATARDKLSHVLRESAPPLS